ncbi:MAG: cupin domain-containing protein [Burkholderiaceae bacterium]
MDRNDDFSRRVVVRTEDMPWLASPMAGVDRRSLDRVGGEVARATSIVRYAPGSRFSPHVHAGGEELFILDGVFEDEHGSFPAGSYLRNPPESRHTPGSTPGCVIFVKLWQFDPADRTQVRVDTNRMAPVEDAERPGVSVIPLFRDERETVGLEYWAADTVIELDAAGGMEVLVLDGDFTESGDRLRRHDWLRLPADAEGKAIAGSRGAKVWIKRGHLRKVEREVAMVRARQ